MSFIELNGDSPSPVTLEVLDGRHPANAAEISELVQLRAQVVQLREATASRQAIGTATGLIAARFHCSTEQAWAVLVRVSQHANVKVRVIARVIVDAHDGRTQPADAAILLQVSAQLPGGWPGTQIRPA
jgi:hypothetical protein